MQTHIHLEDIVMDLVEISKKTKQIFGFDHIYNYGFPFAKLSHLGPKYFLLGNSLSAFLILLD